MKYGLPKWDGIYTDLAKIAANTNVWNTFLPYANKRIKQLGDAQWHQVYQNDTIDARQFVKLAVLHHSTWVVLISAVHLKAFRLYAGFDYAFGFVILNNYMVRGLSQVQGSQNSQQMC